MFRNKKKEKQKIETPREIAIKMMIDGVSSEKISLYSGIPIDRVIIMKNGMIKGR